MPARVVRLAILESLTELLTLPGRFEQASLLACANRMILRADWHSQALSAARRDYQAQGIEPL